MPEYMVHSALKYRDDENLQEKKKGIGLKEVRCLWPSSKLNRMEIHINEPGRDELGCIL